MFVSGKVQGVFYRDTTKKEAAKRGLTGWVRNLRDGRVEAVFQGEEKTVDDIVEWCHVGSPLSRVTHVERIAGEAEEPFGSFDIKPTL